MESEVLKALVGNGPLAILLFWHMWYLGQKIDRLIEAVGKSKA